MGYIYENLKGGQTMEYMYNSTLSLDDYRAVIYNRFITKYSARFWVMFGLATAFLFMGVGGSAAINVANNDNDPYLVYAIEGHDSVIFDDGVLTIDGIDYGGVKHNTDDFHVTPMEVILVVLGCIPILVCCGYLLKKQNYDYPKIRDLYLETVLNDKA